MRRALFGNSGYGLDSPGTEEAVAKLKAADLKSFHKKLAAPNNCVLAIYGDVETAEVKAAVEKLFGHWKSSDAANELIRTSPDAPSPSTQRVEEIRDKKQAVLVIGFPGTTMHDEDRYALDLIQESCSDLGSRLFLRIREQLGLAYYVGAQHFAGLAPGYFAFYAGTEPAKAALVEQEIAQGSRIPAHRRPDRRGTQTRQGQNHRPEKNRAAGPRHLASTTTLDELYGLGYQRAELDDAKYEAVTLEQIKAAAQKYLKPDALVVAVVKPEKV